MPNSADKDKSEAVRVEGESDTPKPPKRLRPRWQRWLLWSSVRLLLLAGVGVGVGTVEWRSRPPDLMAHAKRIASISGASGYYWTPKGELRLYRFTGNATASLKWDQSTQSVAFVETLPKLNGQIVRPMSDYNLFVIRPNQKSTQTKTVYGYTTHPTWTIYYDALPKPDYIFKVKTLPNMIQDHQDVALSRDGKRIAYVGWMPHQNWRDVFWQRLKSGYKPPFRGYGGAILVSAVDGSRTDIVGTVEQEGPDPHTLYSRSGTTFSLQGVFWCPDGKHLSFAYGDGVYEVPVK